jgi:hypothetical protein
LIAQNFNQTLSTDEMDQLPGSFGAAWNLALAEVRGADSNNVPEPDSLVVLAVAAAGLLFRYRRLPLRASGLT